MALESGVVTATHSRFVRRFREFCATPAWAFVLGLAASSACVPPGNAPPFDAGAKDSPATVATTVRQAANVLRTPFEDTFDRPDAESAMTAPSSSSSTALPSLAVAMREGGVRIDGATKVDGNALDQMMALTKTEKPEAGPTNTLGPNWLQAGTSAWRVEGGRLCGEGAKNHGVWLTKALPINARIEFDAVSYSASGDLKAEFWGDGKSAATAISYTNATSYLTIFGGWKNTIHALARIDEHGNDRKEVRVDPTSDDPRQRPVNSGQVYHFKVERADGKTVRWFVDGIEYLSFADTSPLTGVGHDHFGFNDWEAKVCFDNVRVTPL